MKTKDYCIASGILFSLVALVHLLRIIYAPTILVNDFEVPMFASWIGVAVPGSLAFWAFRIASAVGGD